MNPLLTILFLLCIQNSFAAVDSYRRDKDLPGSYLSFGFNNRICEARSEKIDLRYVNVGSDRNDTFTYTDNLTSASNLLTFNVGFSYAYKYVGAKLDMGIVPFANRNYNINLTAFAWLPLHKNVTLAAEIGYTRMRKKRILGRINREDDKSIELDNRYFDELTIMTHQMNYSYFYGMGVYLHLGSDYFLYLSGRHHTLHQSRSTLKVAASDSQSETFLEIFTFDHLHRYGMDDQAVRIKDSRGQNITQYYNIGAWSFTAQICIPLAHL